MTPTTKQKILEILEGDPWKVRTAIREVVNSTEQIEEPKGNRTGQQNSALHVDCALIASKLNDAGLDMRKVLKPTYNLPWTLESVKEHIWRPIMKSLYGHSSTRDLKKVQEIDKIHEVIMRELGEKHGVEWHDFPHDPNRDAEHMGGWKTEAGKHDDNYPEENNNLGDKF